MSSEVALLLSAALIITVLAALLSKSMSLSLIMLFYSSLTLGLIFTVYGGTLVGLLHIITFAGAVSVMLLTVILMTGQSDLNIGSKRLAILLSTITILIALAMSYLLFFKSSGNPTQPPTDTSSQLIGFIWLNRPWDLLILVIIFACSMVAVANLLSKEEQE